MRNILNTTLFGAALMVATAGFAQSSTSPQKGDEDRTSTSPTTSSTRSGTDTNSSSSASGTTENADKTGASGTSGTNGAGDTDGTTASAYGSSMAAPRSSSGTVKTIDAGRTLVITMANGRTQTFDIRSSPTMDSSIAVGSRVRVKRTRDASGHEVVTVEPYR